MVDIRNRVVMKFSPWQHLCSFRQQSLTTGGMYSNWHQLYPFTSFVPVRKCMVNFCKDMYYLSWWYLLVEYSRYLLKYCQHWQKTLTQNKPVINSNNCSFLCFDILKLYTENSFKKVTSQETTFVHYIFLFSFYGRICSISIIVRCLYIPFHLPNLFCSVSWNLMNIIIVLLANY